MFKQLITLSLPLWLAASPAFVLADAAAIESTARLGDALAQAKMGALYLLGREGVEQDDQKAAEWMHKAAEQGLLEAQVIMAALYDRGLGVQHNRDTSTQWYEKAAAQGHGASLAILGRNDVAKGSVAFDYKAARLNAARQIPNEYAKKILLKN
ncbi:MAG: hypothetical protein CTY34_06370 [Methylobacter sp.]|nr:MAG: hypothetical protein CTY34_06370 [Methylobacter sp.]PPD18618.1 MAG: hypothetical protein CTY24_12695 [Methylobacter sp.]